MTRLPGSPAVPTSSSGEDCATSQTFGIPGALPAPLSRTLSDTAPAWNSCPLPRRRLVPTLSSFRRTRFGPRLLLSRSILFSGRGPFGN